MLPYWCTILAMALLAPFAAGDQIYTVWGSVIFNRMGERTPDLLGPPPSLTTIGSQQSFSAGALFRNRYLTGKSDRIGGMNVDMLDFRQLYVLALDQQTSVASAQAFVQGLYPPVNISSSNTTSLNPTSITSSQGYVDAPLGGYQYPQIHVSGAIDADYTYIGGNIYCPAFDQSSLAERANPQYQAMRVASAGVYQTVAPLMQFTLLPGTFAFDYATSIYDYLSYLAVHNSTVASLLLTPQYTDTATNQSYLQTLRWLADAQQQFLLTNMSAYNSISKSNTLPDTSGSISTIAGNMLAGMMLSRLETVIELLGQEQLISVLFGDFEPLVSLFALMNMTHVSPNFTGLPEFASSAVFELFSRENSTNATFPNPAHLFVGFHFRNGTGNSSSLLEYPMFNRGPSDPEMSWYDFQSAMAYAALGNAGDWCTQCGAGNLFCAAWNSSITLPTSSTPYASVQTTRNQISPTAAGAIGAVVALAVAALIFGLVMLVGRVRFHRQPRNAAKELGGFKGSARLASDRDLTLPKGGVTVGATAGDSDMAGHERTGSWEMKNARAGNNSTTAHRGRPSYEEDDDLQVHSHSEPVKVHEQV